MRGMINLLGPLFTRAFRPGAGEVLSARLRTVSDSTTRVDVATPTSGKKIRIIACALSNGTTDASFMEAYFGTGANIGTTAGKEIMEPVLDFDTLLMFSQVWPDGGGPVGAVNEVVSLRTAVNISGGGGIVIQYREE